MQIAAGIFVACMAAGVSAPSVQPSSAMSARPIRAGDQLDVIVVDEPDLTRSYVVGPDGSL